MFAENFDLEKYCDRIGFKDEPKADADTLKKLMQCQLRSVPFENLDVQAGKIVSIVPEDIVEKIINKNRGGYCYEVNGLFAMALQAIGIEYTFLGARPMFYPTRRPKTHMVISATADNQQWICDVGFGSYGICEPLSLNSVGQIVKQGFDSFSLHQLNEREFILKALVGQEWANQYSFDLYPHEFIDFMPANYMNSTHPDAIFVQKHLVVLHNEHGRKILFGDNLRTITQYGTVQSTFAHKDLPQILEQEFDLSIE